MSPLHCWVWIINPAHPHAATAAGSNSYTYDENGNTLAPALEIARSAGASAGVTCRLEGGKVYVQRYNAENRISSIDLVEGSCETPGNILTSWGCSSLPVI